FQKLYKELVRVSNGRRKPERMLKEFCERAQVLNAENRITGNALIEIVDEIMLLQKRSGQDMQIQKIIDRLIMEHLGFPEVQISRHYKNQKPSVRLEILDRIYNIVQENSETI